MYIFFSDIYIINTVNQCIAVHYILYIIIYQYYEQLIYKCVEVPEFTHIIIHTYAYEYVSVSVSVYVYVYVCVYIYMYIYIYIYQCYVYGIKRHKTTTNNIYQCAIQYDNLLYISIHQYIEIACNTI